MRTPMSLVPLLLLFLGLPSAAKSDDGAPPNAPKSIEEARSRLEKVLGRFDQENPRQWRASHNQEIKFRPEPSQPEVLQSSHVTTVYGNPYLVGDTVAFDEIELLDGTYENIARDGKRTFNQRRMRYYFRRWVIRQAVPGSWTAEITIVAHSHPTFIGSTDRGTVSWRENGFSFKMTGTDRHRTAAKGYVPIIYTNQYDFNLIEDQLLVQLRNQQYQPLKDSEGVELPIPDLDRPMGEAVRIEVKAQKDTTNSGEAQGK